MVKPKKNQELESLTFGQLEVNTCVAIHSNPIDHNASLKGTDLGEKAGLFSRGWKQSTASSIKLNDWLREGHLIYFYFRGRIFRLGK